MPPAPCSSVLRYSVNGSIKLFLCFLIFLLKIGVNCGGELLPMADEGKFIVVAFIGSRVLA